MIQKEEIHSKSCKETRRKKIKLKNKNNDLLKVT